MDENEIEGGAGPALAAHSKDASAPGATPTSSVTGNDHEAPDITSEIASRLSRQAGQAARQVGPSISDVAETMRNGLSETSGRVAEQAAEFVREQPFVALAITGVVCLAVGVALGRR